MRTVRSRGSLRIGGELTCGRFPQLGCRRTRPAGGKELSGGAWAAHWRRRCTSALLRLGAESGATLYMTLLAGFQVLLGRWEQGRRCVGRPIANRTDSG